jgi:hypothetical protein
MTTKYGSIVTNSGCGLMSPLVFVGFYLDLFIPKELKGFLRPQRNSATTQHPIHNSTRNNATMQHAIMQHAIMQQCNNATRNNTATTLQQQTTLNNNNTTQQYNTQQ